jgi:hypothetical protein
MGGKSGGNKAANQARADEQARQAKIREGTERIGGIFDSQFNDQFFDGRRQAFLDYARPQLEDQFGDAQKQLTFALARGGNLDSSVRGQKSAELQKQFDLNQQQIADKALSSSTESRNAVEDARSNLVATLNATGDAQGAANSAIARASALSQPVAFSPLTQLFADFTQGLGQQAALERADSLFGRGAGGEQIGRYNTGLFGSNKSMKVQS